MSLQMELLLFATGSLGHVAICVSALNRIQGCVAEYSLEKRLKRCVAGWAFIWLCVPLVVTLTSEPTVSPWAYVARQFYAEWGYYSFAGMWLFAVALQRLLHVVTDRCPRAWDLLSSDVRDINRLLGKRFVKESISSFQVSLWGNEVGQLDVNRKSLKLVNLPKELDGLTITHFSDLHITGAIVRQYYAQLKEEIQKLDSDLIILTGDILDDLTRMDWVLDLLSGMKARAGCYFVLGNHDVRHGQDQLLRAELERIGWQDLGGKTRQIEFHGQLIDLVGNELPWIGTAPENNTANKGFSICAVHTPDLLQWGRQSDFNLMLAGHAHGGQIRLPIIGPVVCPSAHGVRYASGVFEAGETLLHVSRGVSGYHPLRWRCCPKLTQLVLTARVP